MQINSNPYQVFPLIIDNIDLEISTLYSLACSAKTFQFKIENQFFLATRKANELTAVPLNELLNYSKIAGQQIKCLNFKLESMTSSPEGSVQVADKIISILKECPKLALLSFKPSINSGIAQFSREIKQSLIFKILKNNLLIPAINVDNLPLLERFKFTMANVWIKISQNTTATALNLQQFKRLQQFSLKNIELNNHDIHHISTLTTCNHIQLDFNFPHKYEPNTLFSLEKLQKNCLINLNLSNYCFSFPTEKLKLIQALTCRMKCFIISVDIPTDEQILLLKPFEYVTMSILPQIPLDFNDRIMRLLPDLKFEFFDLDIDTDADLGLYLL